MHLTDEDILYIAELTYRTSSAPGTPRTTDTFQSKSNPLRSLVASLKYCVPCLVIKRLSYKSTSLDYCGYSSSYTIRRWQAQAWTRARTRARTYPITARARTRYICVRTHGRNNQPSISSPSSPSPCLLFSYVTRLLLVVLIKPVQAGLTGLSGYWRIWLYWLTRR